MAEIRIPELAESITEGTIATWLKKPGDSVEVGETVLELETDKINVDIISDYRGVITKILKDEGDTVFIGEVVAVVEERDVVQDIKTDDKKVEAMPEKNEERLQISPEKYPDVIATPAARKMAREQGIALDQVNAVDPLGRIQKHDLVRMQQEQQRPAIEPSTSTLTFEETTTAKPVERIKMSRRRQTIARNLLEVKQTTAMLTTFNEIDMSQVIALRKKRQEEFIKEHDIKLGFMSFFTKAVVAALKKFPLLNAEISGDEIIVKKYYDIGIAVSTDHGLVVPVVRDADRKNFAEIEKDIADLANKARNNQLQLKDLQGGTFTITNGGVFGSLFSTPILNSSQVGILGMHAIQNRPVAIEHERIEIRPMMYVALSYDHRVIDGKEAVSFLAAIKEMIEDPEKLLLES